MYSLYCIVLFSLPCGAKIMHDTFKVLAVLRFIFTAWSIFYTFKLISRDRFVVWKQFTIKY